MAKGSLKAGDDDETKPLKYLSLAEGLERAKYAKGTAVDAKPSKKRTASKSPLREEKKNGLFGSSDEEKEEGAIH
ncbi:hypothetical protein PInf_008060 [Phytophthora infestans]|nr:hypothetical protein PInf_008060 [Phytophthora infestans]